MYLDYDYYKKLGLICENLFGVSPKIFRKPNKVTLNILSKRLFEMLTNRFNIPPGKKCYTVKIPNEILKSEERLINATLRGMFDTDGGVGFDKRKAYKKPYIRVNYTSSNHFLIDQVHDILEKNNIPHSIHKRKNSLVRQIQIMEKRT